MSIRNVLIAGILLSTALAANATTAQQDKMKDCNAQAKEQHLAGADRKGFMKTCLSNAPAAAPEAKALTPQQEKMKTCNADAKSKALKGAERKEFMKTCLSGGK
jgi:hypothetical protein